jgi:NADH-quinone oxidoreductase subunit L
MLDPLPIDALEVFNAASSPRCNARALEYARRRGLPTTAASDAHHAAGHGHGHGHGGFHPHAPRIAINAVLAILAVGAILAALPSFLKGADGRTWVETMISDSTALAGSPDRTAAAHAVVPATSEAAGDAAHGGHAHHTILGMDAHMAMLVFAIVIAIVGIGGAAYFHLVDRKAADGLKQSLLASPLTGWLPRALENKWYVDELYDALFRYPTRGVAWLFARIDGLILDGGIVNGLGRLTVGAGRLFQPLYNGLLQGYAVVMVGGLGLILLWIVWMFTKTGGAS